MSACYETGAGTGTPPWLRAAFPSLLFYQSMNRCITTLPLKSFRDRAPPTSRLDFWEDLSRMSSLDRSESSEKLSWRRSCSSVG